MHMLNKAQPLATAALAELAVLAE
jgi:hypothetical protein